MHVYLVSFNFGPHRVFSTRFKAYEFALRYRQDYPELKWIPGFYDGDRYIALWREGMYDCQHMMILRLPVE